jgi:RNA polymerase sigma factor (sigma-70 family)
MGDSTGDMPGQGIEAVLVAHRAQLLRFLVSHGAGDAAEDLLQDLWMRMSDRPTGPVANPLSYLYRAANNLMIDRHRAERQARLREQAWTESHGRDETSSEPSAEEAAMSREELQRLNAALLALGERPAACFRRFRLDGIPQKQIAQELGVSLSTVESDLRRAYAALMAARRQSDDA